MFSGRALRRARRPALREFNVAATDAGLRLRVKGGRWSDHAVAMSASAGS